MTMILNRLASFPAGRFALAATLALLLAACAASLPPRPDVPYGSGLLWQVEKEGQDPSYVFGTMHVPDPEILDLPAPVEDAFARSQQAAFELVTDKTKLAEELRLFTEAAMLPKDQRLSQLLGDVAYAQLIRIALRQRPSVTMIGGMHISQFKPWFVMLIVGRNDASASHLSRAAPTLDDWLEARAEKDGKKVVGLETFAEQLAVFNDLEMSDQVAVLVARLTDYNNWRSYRTSAELYLQGDTGMFYGIWLEQLGRLEPNVADRFAERFLDGRNRLMVERAMPLMEEASTFVAVGALHLPGEQGVLRLLERRGYRVTRLN